MNIVESLKDDIEETKRICWNKDSSRQLLNQITIMEALVVLLERTNDSCGACGGAGTVTKHSGNVFPFDGSITKTTSCLLCNGSGKKY